MKNLAGTEVISRALEVLFVAGLLRARPVALQLALVRARGHASWRRPLTLVKGLRTCALHAEDPLAFRSRLVHVTNQIDAAADHNNRWDGPENKYRHHILPNLTCRP